MKYSLIAVSLLMMLSVFTGCSLLGIEIPKTDTSSQTSTASAESLPSSTESQSGTSTETETTSSETAETTASTATQTDPGEKTDLLIYYTDIDGYLIPVTVKVPKTYQVAAASLEKMMKNNENFLFAAEFELFPIFPEGTEIKSLTVQDGVAVIDFNENILNYSTKIEEYNIFSSIVYVLTGFSTVDSVQIKIGGVFPGEMKHGAIVDRQLARKDVMINSNKFLTAPSMLKYDIYFIKPVGNTEYLLPLSAEFPQMPAAAFPEKMLEIMIHDYSEFDIYSLIPEETKVIGSSLDDNGIMEVILSSELAGYGGGSARETGLLNQLLYTFSQIKGAERIKLTVEGSNDILPEGTEISEPFTVSKFINILD